MLTTEAGVCGSLIAMVIALPMIPFWGKCTTHLVYFSEAWDVHWGFDPHPYQAKTKFTDHPRPTSSRFSDPRKGATSISHPTGGFLRDLAGD